jgi:thiol:disulfide interchange protein DsbD
MLVSIATPPSCGAEPVRTRYVEAQLVSEVEAIKAGEPFWLGVRLAMDPEWHTYWRNSGDAGLPTTIAWRLPEGFSAAEIQWPYPERFERARFVSYGYGNEVLLIAQITPPAELTAGASINLMARADWTVCREDLCTPDGADLMLDLDVGRENPPLSRYWAPHFAKTRARLPRPSREWKATARLATNAIKLTLTPESPRDVGTITVMEGERRLLARDRSVEVVRDGDTVELSLPVAADNKPARLSVVLVAAGYWDEAARIKALEVSIPVSAE